MKKISVILKVTNKCNLRCKYCYNSTTGYGDKVLPLEYFEKLLNLLVAKYDTIQLMWHGGEPLCAGLEYFQKAMEIEQKVRYDYQVTITNSVQTNATLINKDWIKFLKANDFSIGLSFDGINNEKYRQQTDKVLQAMKLLKRENLKFGCVAVVADDDYDLLANYKWFAQNNTGFDFNFVFPEGNAKDLPITSAKSFADKMCDLFDYWLYDKNGVNIRTFSFYINMSLGGCARICSHISCHTKYLGLCPDGTLQNCGRESVAQYPFGNIQDINSIDEAFCSKGALELIKGSVVRRNKCKDSCEFFSLCQGGCVDCAIWDGGVENIPETACLIFRTIYTKVRDTFRTIMEKNIPLTELNPAVKHIISSKYIRTDIGLQDELAQGYIQLWTKH